MEEAEDVKCTNSSLHYFMQRYKHIKHFSYQGSQTLTILMDANTKSVKCERARRNRRHLLQGQIVTQEFKFPPAFFTQCVCIFVLKPLNNANIRVMEAQRITFQFVF